MKIENVVKGRDQMLASTLHDVRSGVGGLNGIGDELKSINIEQNSILEKLATTTDHITFLILQNKLQVNLNRVNELLSDYDQSSRAITNLTTDFLDAKKLEAGKWELNPEKFFVEASVKSVIALFGPKAKEKEITLDYKGLGKDIQIIGDSNLLYRVLLNLLSNALKYTPKKGFIQITLQAILVGEGQVNVICSVKDSGRGMNEEQRLRLFVPFSQACPEDAKNGTGYGLVNCKNFVEMMGGKIEVASTVDQGSTFTFNITCEAVAKPVSRPLKVKNLAPKSFELKNVRVLIVDDNNINQMMLRRSIQAEGGTVVVAANGQEALDQLACAKFDIVLMDLEMPVMNGLAATREIRRRERGTNSGQRTPIIALSAHTGSDIKETTEGAEMDGYLTKPFVNTVIIASIKQQLKFNTKPDPDKESKYNDEQTPTQVETTPKEEKTPPKKPGRQGFQRSNSDELPAGSFSGDSALYTQQAEELLIKLHEQLFVTFPSTSKDDVSINLRRRYLMNFAKCNQQLGTKEGLSSYEIETLKKQLANLEKLASAPDLERAALLSPQKSSGYNPSFQFNSSKRKLGSENSNVLIPKCS